MNHPPSYQNQVRIDGQEALVEYFASSRGEQDLEHEIERAVGSRNQVAFIGHQTR